MDSHASSPFRDTQALRRRIADVVYRSFRRALIDRCDDRHGQDVTMERSTTARSTRVRLQCPGQEALTARLAVQHVGGNVYDIRCTIEGGPSRTFVYSLSGEPESDAPLARVPRLGREIARFALDALEQSLGCQGLRPE